MVRLAVLPQAWFVLSTLLLLSVNGLLYRGADISSLPKQESWGKKFRDYQDPVARPLEQILARENFNLIRLRLLVNPAYDYGIHDTLRLAKRIKAAGMKLELTLHLSDEMADPSHQKVPAAWRSRTIEEVMRHLYQYTKYVGDTFAEYGVFPDFVSVGNEVRAGLLFPFGQYPNHEAMSRLFKAGVNGLRASKSAHTKILIHVDSQGRWDWVAEFFNSVLAFPNSPVHLQLRDFDVIGHTFYPYYASWSTFANQETVVRNCAKFYRKEQHIVETNWPVACAKKDLSRWPADQRAIPFSPEGQLQYLTRVSRILGITAMIIWEPAWLTFPGEGNTCEDDLLFEPDGRGRKSLTVFKPRRRDGDDDDVDPSRHDEPDQPGDQYNDLIIHPPHVENVVHPQPHVEIAA